MQLGRFRSIGDSGNFTVKQNPVFFLSNVGVNP